MKKLVSILSFVALWSYAVSSAQLLAPNEVGVTMGHLDTIVRDVEVTKKFWILLGGTPIKVRGMDVMKFPGVFVFLRKGEPSGGSIGTTVDHPGFHVPNGDEFLAKMKAAGVKVEPNPRRSGLGYLYTPDDLRVEILGNEVLDDKITIPIVSQHIHFSLPPSAVTEAQAWYGKMFGAVATVGPQNSAAADLPGARLYFGKSPNPPLPTEGRSLDHIGFEVENLEAFCKQLEASGVKFDKPYSKSGQADYASAELTDPWGTRIELTDGLDRL